MRVLVWNLCVSSVAWSLCFGDNSTSSSCSMMVILDFLVSFSCSLVFFLGTIVVTWQGVPGARCKFVINSEACMCWKKGARFLQQNRIDDLLREIRNNDPRKCNVAGYATSRITSVFNLGPLCSFRCQISVGNWLNPVIHMKIRYVVRSFIEKYIRSIESWNLSKMCVQVGPLSDFGHGIK